MNCVREDKYKVNIPDKVVLDVERIIDRAADKDQAYTDGIEDILLLVLYGQSVLSQNGLGLTGFAFRHKFDNWVMTVKVNEGGTPLVGFVTSHTPTGCIQNFWRLIEDDRLRWQRDKFPPS